jgi:prefoldin subunit 5
VSCYDDSPILERLETLEKTTISALQASISALEAKDADILKSIAALEGSDSATQEEIQTLKTLSSEIEKTIVELREWIEKILEGYYTSEEIDEQLASINKEIQSLTEKVSSLESKLNNLTAEFSIVFDDSEVGILAGGTTSVGYTITGATDKTTVKALGQNGWSAKVTPEGTDKGKITVTAPNPLTEDEIIVLVYDGEYRTIMSSINFVTGVVTPSQTAVELEAEAGTVDITVTSNLIYKVSIPEDAKDWLSTVETRATHTETITFAYTANEFTIRQTDILFLDDANNIFTKIHFIQQGSVTEVTLAEAGTLLDAIGAEFLHKIKSLKINGPINGTDIKRIRSMSALKSLDLTNSQIVSGGEAYIETSYGSSWKTSNNVIGREMFYKTQLEVIYLPEHVTEIGQDAFGWCQNLNKVIMGDEVTIIGGNAFSVCSSLESINLSQKVKRLENGAFSGSKIKSINLPNMLEYIGPNCFNNCSFLASITIPENTQSIGERAFNGCFALKEIHVKAQPQTLTNIGENLFSYFSSSGTDNSLYEKAVLYIPLGSKAYYYSTDFGRFTNIIEE